MSMKVYRAPWHDKGEKFIIVFDDEVCAYVGWKNQPSARFHMRAQRRDIEALNDMVWGPPVYQE